MTVPFRDSAELETGGNAAFLRILPGRHERQRVGALFQVNARGEPVEFTFNHADLPRGALWRPDDLVRHTAKVLAMSLFEAAQRSPLVLLCRADEIDVRLFQDELQVQLPVCRVALEGDAIQLGQDELREEFGSAGRIVHLFWLSEVPGPESPPHRLLLALARRGMLLEPFDRIAAGIEEALGEEPEEAASP